MKLAAGLVLGDQVYLQTATPVAAKEEIVTPGTCVQGTLSHVKHSGRIKGRAELALHPESLTLPSGKMLRLAVRKAR